ncbi:unnamed protein product [Rhodiola kirilowii]
MVKMMDERRKTLGEHRSSMLPNMHNDKGRRTILGHCPISLAVPVTNATTFVAIAVTAMILGEKTRVGFAFFGTLLIVLGVWICIN